MTAKANITLIENLYSSFKKGDVPALLEAMAENIDWGIEAAASQEVPWHGTGTGKSFATKFFTALGTHCEFPRFEPSGFLASDSNVACLVTFEVVLKKNGRRAIYNVLHHFTIANGKITKWRGTEDTAQTKALWNS
jgi:ketosteroid isomerase-like protein